MFGMVIVILGPNMGLLLGHMMVFLHEGSIILSYAEKNLPSIQNLGEKHGENIL